MSNSENILHTCPECGERFISKNPHFPFCSERCKCLDLGAWTSEEYRLPDQSPIPDELIPVFEQELLERKN